MFHTRWNICKLPIWWDQISIVHPLCFAFIVQSSVWDVDFLYLNLVKTSESGTLQGCAAIGIPTESNKVLQDRPLEAKSS